MRKIAQGPERNVKTDLDFDRRRKSDGSELTLSDPQTGTNVSQTSVLVCRKLPQFPRNTLRGPILSAEVTELPQTDNSSNLLAGLSRRTTSFGDGSRKNLTRDSISAVRAVPVSGFVPRRTANRRAASAATRTD